MKLTSFGCRWISHVHIRAGGCWCCFSGIQCHNLAFFLQVDCHEEAAANAHAVGVEHPVAEQDGNGRVNRCASPL